MLVEGFVVQEEFLLVFLSFCEMNEFCFKLSPPSPPLFLISKHRDCASWLSGDVNM
jgi:hypothetical protein